MTASNTTVARFDEKFIIHNKIDFEKLFIHRCQKTSHQN